MIKVSIYSARLDSLITLSLDFPSSYPMRSSRYVWRTIMRDCLECTLEISNPFSKRYGLRFGLALFTGL